MADAQILKKIRLEVQAGVVSMCQIGANLVGFGSMEEPLRSLKLENYMLIFEF